MFDDLTDGERAVLYELSTDDYAPNWWLDVAVYNLSIVRGGKSTGGFLTSLAKKGYIGLDAEEDMLWLTELGQEYYVATGLDKNCQYWAERC